MIWREELDSKSQDCVLGPCKVKTGLLKAAGFLEEEINANISVKSYMKSACID